MFRRLAYLKNDWSGLLLVLIACSLSFERFPSFDMGGMTIRTSTVLGLLLIGSVIVSSFSDKGLSRKLPRGLVSILLLWLIWLGAGLIHAQDLKAGLRVYMPLVFFVLLSISVAAILNIKRLAVSVGGILAGAGLSAIFGLFQFFGNRFGLSNAVTGIRPEYSWEHFGFPRIHAGALEPLYFSNFLLLPLSILIVLLAKKYLSLTWLTASLLGLLLIVDILTISRGGLATLIVMLFTLAIVFIRRSNITMPKRKTLAAGTIGLFVIVFVVAATISLVAREGSDSDVTYGKRGVGTFLSHLQNTHISPTVTNKSNDDSVNQRSSARNQALSTLNNYPNVLLFGVGVGQYDSFTRQHNIGGYSMSNNLILEQLLQTGLVGLGLLMLFGLLLIRRLFLLSTVRQGFEGYLSGALAAYFVAVLFQAQTFSGIGLTHLWFSIGLSLFLVQLHQIGSARHDKEKNKEEVSA